MAIGEGIYSSVPPLLQNGLITLKGAYLAAERYGRTYRRTIRELPAVLALPEDRLYAYQMSSLRSFLGFAKAFSPFYAERLRNVRPEDIRCISDLRSIPLLEKEELRQNISDIYTVGAGKCVEGHTGGTTGKSLVVRFTRSDFQRRMANLDYFRVVHGVRHRMRRATFSGKNLDPRNAYPDVVHRTNWALNQRFYDTFRLQRGNVLKYVDDWNRFRPEIIDGFPSGIEFVCSFVRSQGTRLSFQPRAVFPTSEPVTQAFRDVVRDVLGVEPRNQYASSEGAPFVVECTSGNLHFWSHTGVIETDSRGDAVVTSFTTRGTPLIRYRIGDVIRFADPCKRCDCGWSGPLVDSIEGREMDYLEGPDGRRIMAANMANTVKNVPNAVVRAQFIQRASDSVEVLLVVDQSKYVPEHAEIVEREVRSRLGDMVSVNVCIVDDIPLSASGKYRMIISDRGA